MSNCSNHKICIDSALSEAEKICQQKNIRLTEIRKTILKIITFTDLINVLLKKS